MNHSVQHPTNSKPLKSNPHYPGLLLSYNILVLSFVQYPMNVRRKIRDTKPLKPHQNLNSGRGEKSKGQQIEDKNLPVTELCMTLYLTTVTKFNELTP
jgi:hypothetical protein